jgi:hypothetical protein
VAVTGAVAVTVSVTVAEPVTVTVPVTDSVAVKVYGYRHPVSTTRSGGLSRQRTEYRTELARHFACGYFKPLVHLGLALGPSWAG